MNLSPDERTQRLRPQAAIRLTSHPPTESRLRRRRVHPSVSLRAHIRRRPCSTGQTFKPSDRPRGSRRPTTATTMRGWARLLFRRTAAAAGRAHRALRALSRTATSRAGASGERTARTRTTDREGRTAVKVRPGRVEKAREARGPTTALALDLARDQVQARVRGRRAIKRQRLV